MISADVRPLGDRPNPGLVRTEQMQLLVRSRGAPEMFEHGRVVGVGDEGLGQVHVSSDLRRDDARSDRLLGSLPHRQVGAHRESGKEVGKTKLILRHEPSRDGVACRGWHAHEGEWATLPMRGEACARDDPGIERGGQGDGHELEGRRG